MLQTLNGSIDTSSNNNFVNELATQLLIQKQGTYSSLTTLPTNFNYKCYKASSGICGDFIKRPKIDGNKVFMTNGGVLYIIHNSTNSNCTSSQSQVKMNPAEVLPQNNVCGTFFIDLNGDKNPNQIGVDMHLAYLLKNNNRYYVRFSGANVDSNCSAEHSNVSSYSLHCTNRMLLGEPMP